MTSGSARPRRTILTSRRSAGDALDAGITSKPDKSSSGFNTFYIPSVYGIVDQSQLVVK